MEPGSLAIVHNPEKPNCVNPVCYKITIHERDLYGDIPEPIKERIEGCATLNVNKDCIYFEKKKWWGVKN